MLSETLFALKFVGLCALIVQCGRSTLRLALGNNVGGLALDPREYSYVALSFAVGVALVEAIVLRAVGRYSAFTMVGALVAITAVATLATARATAGRRAPRERAIWWPAYLATALLLVAFTSPEAYPLQQGSATYLLQGFDLFEANASTQWPYFGDVVTMPLLFVTHAIGALFNLFSGGLPYRFYVDGLFWANVLMAPLVPIGSYLFFRRKLHPTLAVAVSAIFCASILQHRVWSVRGETLGWIAAFALLIAADALADAIGKRQPRPTMLRLSFCLAVIYLTVALTHGVAAFVATAAAGALVLYRVLVSARAGRAALLADVGFSTSCFLATLIVLGLLYTHAFAGPGAGDFGAFGTASPAQQVEPDGAVLFDNALIHPDRSSAPLTRSNPPYLAPTTVAEFSALLPAASLFRPVLGEILVADFPGDALRNLARISWPERAGYLCVLLLVCSLFMRRATDDAENARRQLVFVSLVAYFVIVAFCLYLNARSTSIFPLAAARRLYPYARFFFWLAAGLALFEGVTKYLIARSTPRPAPADGARSRVGWILVGSALPVCIGLSLWDWTGGSAFTAGGWARRAGERESMFEAVVQFESAKPKTPRAATHDSLRSLQSLFAGIETIRRSTSPGEYVYVNILSDNQFWYLSRGRHSLLEGSAMYQVYPLQGPAAERIMRFRQFAATADLSWLQGHPVEFVLLYKHLDCLPLACYGFKVVPVQLEAFAHNPEYQVLQDNDDFALLRVVRSTDARQ